MRPRSLPCLNANAQGTSNAPSEEQRPMTRTQLPLALLGLLLTMLASCSSPPGRNQQAAIHNRDGVPCFGVPDTKEARANPPLITAISVTEIGRQRASMGTRLPAPWIHRTGFTSESGPHLRPRWRACTGPAASKRQALPGCYFGRNARRARSGTGAGFHRLLLYGGSR